LNPRFEENNMKVGIIGLGRMGTGIAANIVRAGHSVVVWNRSRAALTPLLQLGAVEAGTACDALRGDMVISMLANDQAFVDVGLDGPLLAEASSSLVHVNTSTVSVELSRRLARIHANARVAYVAATVFGRAAAAAAGTLTVVAAGPQAAVERVTPILRALAKDVFIVGEDPQKANLVKIAGNLMLAGVIESFAEAYSLVRKGGVDPNVFYDVVTSNLFSSPAYKDYGKLILNGEDQPPGFLLKWGLKDVCIALAAGAEMSVPLPLASLIRDHLLEAIARGHGEKDWVSFADVVASHAGLD
jgi:3-hydroxyisobutyrate dehydrogenase-like beta-hydroxyacid dehydrogenase